jgi:predicted CxxxxCH...CXXCH cytochrome family protein
VGGDSGLDDCAICHVNVGSYPLHIDHVDDFIPDVTVGIGYTGDTSTATTLAHDGYCTGACHETSAADGRWNDGELDCDACHYWEATPVAGNNVTSGDMEQISKASHDGHFSATGRNILCTDCHADNSGDGSGATAGVTLSHINDRTGANDGARITGMAAASQDEALISTTTWITNPGTEWSDAADTCTNMCHDPSADATTSSAWGSTNDTCTFCHSMTDPATGSHTAHMNASGTYGISPACTSCHVDNGTTYGHMTGAVALSLTSLTYTGTEAAPYGAPFGTCSTSDCHNDGTGSPVISSTWGSTAAGCNFCHAGNPSTLAHNEHLAVPTYVCDDCHTGEDTSNHINNSVSIVGTITYTGNVTVGDGGSWGNCSSGACHDIGSDINWNANATDCDECHYDTTADINNFNGIDKTASEVNSSQYTGTGHGAQAINCLDCHSMGIAHDFTATLNASGNPFRIDTAGGFTCSDTSAGCHNTGAPAAVINHSAAAITGAGGSVNYTWTFNPECLNCHDPHGDSSYFMINTQLYGEETGTFNPTGTPPSEPTEQTGLSYADTTTGTTAAGDSYADSNSPYSSICQECHTQTSGWVDDTSANYSGHASFPNNPGDCDACHTHDTGFTAGCAGCHDYPPTTGAHSIHMDTSLGRPGFDCETCHGPNPGSASWHNESSVSSYSSTLHYANITLMSDLSGAQQGAEAAYYNTTWTRSASAVAPSTTGAAGYAFQCENVYCHGMDTVTWTWTQTGTVNNPANLEEVRLCGGCHGVATDIDGDGTLDPDHNGDGVVDVASFRSRGGTLYEATSTAANYEGPMSMWGRGGHGDTTINSGNSGIFTFHDSAPGKVVQVACRECHDITVQHMGISGSFANPYRLDQPSYPGEDTNQTDITNLCTQSDCHPKTSTITSTGSYAYLESFKHPNDYFDHPVNGPGAITVPSAGQPLYLNANGDSTTPQYDPANEGIHIDRYLDHWGYWGGTSNDVTNSTIDDIVFLPLGDSLAVNASGAYNNDTADRITCITCHNPHGTDLNVDLRTPFNPGVEKQVPINVMLRLRQDDSELCEGCH